MTARRQPIAPLYAPEADIAAMLGRSVDWLRKNARDLEQQCGFPKVDTAIGLRHVPSVQAWADERNRRRQNLSVQGQPSHEENHDAF